MKNNITKYKINYTHTSNRSKTNDNKINNGNIIMQEDEYVFNGTNKGTPNLHKRNFDLKTAIEELHNYYYK